MFESSYGIEIMAAVRGYEIKKKVDKALIDKKFKEQSRDKKKDKDKDKK